ncbi:MAG: hypothetical protein HFE86_03365 [Clostridiales bacterium]|nr:hypothetical protein [Clostridiales bacterium]
MISKKAKAAALAAAMILTAGLLSSCSKAEDEVSSMVSQGKNDLSSAASDIKSGASEVGSKAGEIVSGAESNLSSMGSNGKVDSDNSGGSITSK